MHPVLLLHGALGASSQLIPLKEHLEEAGYTVFSLDFSGHNGRPFAAEFGIGQFASDVSQFLDSKKIPTVDIFGYSMGGYVALWLAVVAPSRVGRIVTLGTKFDWSVESANHEVKKLNPDKIVEKVPAFARILETRHAPVDWKDLMSKTAAMMLTLGNQPLLTEEIISKVTQDILILLGDQDDMADRTYSESVARMLPSGEFRLLANTPHPIEKVDRAMLVKILREHFRF